MKVIKVIAKTKASKSEILEFNEEKQAFKVSVKAPPEKGKANQEIIKLFRKKYKAPVEIISGFTSKEKLLKILQ